MTIVLNEALWPLVIATCPPHQTGDDHWRELVLSLSVLRGRGERFVLVCDVRGAAIPSSSQRRIVIDALAAGQLQAPDILAAAAVIVDSVAFGGVVTAVGWFKPSAMPLRAFVSSAAALVWAREQLARNFIAPSRAASTSAPRPSLPSPPSSIARRI